MSRNGLVITAVLLIATALAGYDLLRSRAGGGSGGVGELGAERDGTMAEHGEPMDRLEDDLMNAASSTTEDQGAASSNEVEPWRSVAGTASLRWAPTRRSTLARSADDGDDATIGEGDRQSDAAGGLRRYRADDDPPGPVDRRSPWRALTTAPPAYSGPATANDAASVVDGEGAFSGELHLVLRRALPLDPGHEGANLVLFAQAEAGRWSRVWGRGLTTREHIGLVREATVDGATVKLRLALLVQGDFWLQGVWPAFLSVELEDADPASYAAAAADLGGEGVGRLLAGRFVGTFRGRRVEGQVQGRLLQPRESASGRVASFEPPRPDEHPRLLLRKHDLPSLREKLNTPFGQAFRRRAEAGGPICMGLLYQLTGDEKYAQRARQMVDRGGRDIPIFGFGSGGFGHQIFQAAVTYDLCTDAWPEPFNAWMRRQLRDFTERQQLILMTSHANFHPCSNYYGPGRGVPGITSMALWGLAGPPPQPPTDPLTTARTIPPIRLPESAPALDESLRLGAMPTGRWVWSGLLPRESSRDILASIGGYTSAAAVEGTTVEIAVRQRDGFGRNRVVFGEAPADAIQPAGIDPAAAARAIGVEGVSAHREPFAAVFCTTVRVDQLMTVASRAAGRDEVRLFLSGVELQPGEYYRVEPGDHALLIEYRGRASGPAIALDLVSPGDVAGDEIRGLYEIERALYEQDLALWEQTGIDPATQFWLWRGWFQNWQHYRWGMGDGGFKAETGGYASIASWYPTVYASMYTRFFGVAPSPYEDVGATLPRQMMQAVFGPTGPVRTIKLNSAIGLDQRWMAAGFPTIPERYKPAAAWMWRRIAGMAGPVVDDARWEAIFRGRRGGLDDFALAKTFLDYPLELKPVHPDQGMPPQWEAAAFGHYTMRSGFDADAFLTQVFLKARPIVGWSHPNAGAIRVHGLGRDWSDAPSSRNGVREQYSVVLLPQRDDLNTGGCAHLVDWRQWGEKAWSMTMDMSEVYASRSRGVYDHMLIRDASKLAPSGVTGLRAVAVDYSGRCGAPAMVVLVDRVEGAGQTMWTWRKSNLRTTIDDSGFTLASADASLRANVIAPGGSEADIASAVDKLRIGNPRTGFHGSVDRVRIDGRDSYFVIMTIQRGEPPAVSVRGEGLDAVATIGKRTVRFDGRRILLGDVDDADALGDVGASAGDGE